MLSTTAVALFLRRNVSELFSLVNIMLVTSKDGKKIENDCKYSFIKVYLCKQKQERPKKRRSVFRICKA